MIDKRKLNNLIQDLFEFERENLYKSNIHQATIDIVENIEVELSAFSEEDYALCLFEDLVGSYIYSIENTLEICKEDIIDHSILNNLLNLFKQYEQVLT